MPTRIEQNDSQGKSRTPLGTQGGQPGKENFIVVLGVEEGQGKKKRRNGDRKLGEMERKKKEATNAAVEIVPWRRITLY